MLLVQKQMSERVTALARHDFPERPHQNAHLNCLVSIFLLILLLIPIFTRAPLCRRAPRALPLERGNGCSCDFTSTCAACQVETEGLRRSIQNLGVMLTTAAVAHTSVATGEGLRHAATGQHHTVTVTTKDKVRPLLKSKEVAGVVFFNFFSPLVGRTASWCGQETPS